MMQRKIIQRPIFLIFIFFIIIDLSAYAKVLVGPERYEQLTGKSAQKDIKGQWDILYGRSGFVYGKKPSKFLADNFHLIASKGKVLDIGMGEGRNSVFLATKKFDVTGIDISSVAIKKAELLAKEFQTRIQVVEADAQQYDGFKPETFDAIICFYYVDRKLIPKIKKWLKPGGYIFYEAYTIEQKKLGKFNTDPDDFYLKSGELLTLFKSFKVIKHEEITGGSESIASMVARKI